MGICKFFKIKRFWELKSPRFLLDFEWTSQGLNLGPPDYEPQISIFMIFYDM